VRNRNATRLPDHGGQETMLPSIITNLLQFATTGFLMVIFLLPTS
jgi:hypothetical protein